MSRVLKVQKCALIDFMSANYDSIFGKHASIKGPNLRKKKWLELSEFCNQLGPPHKTIEEWKRCWTDLKSTTKKKLAEVRRQRMATGSGAPTTTLSENDLKIINIVKLENMCGLPNIYESPVRNLQDVNFTQDEVNTQLNSTELNRSLVAPNTQANNPQYIAEDQIDSQLISPSVTVPPASDNLTEIEGPHDGSTLVTQNIELLAEANTPQTPRGRDINSLTPSYEHPGAPSPRQIDPQLIRPSVTVPPASNNLSEIQGPHGSTSITPQTSRGRDINSLNPSYEQPSLPRPQTRLPRRRNRTNGPYATQTQTTNQMLHPIAPAYLSRNFDYAVQLQENQNNLMLRFLNQQQTIINLLESRPQNPPNPEND